MMFFTQLITQFVLFHLSTSTMGISLPGQDPICDLELTFIMRLEIMGQKFKIPVTDQTLQLDQRQKEWFEYKFSWNKQLSFLVAVFYSFNFRGDIKIDEVNFYVYDYPQNVQLGVFYLKSFDLQKSSKAIIYKKTTMIFSPNFETWGSLYIDNFNAVCTFFKLFKFSEPETETESQGNIFLEYGFDSRVMSYALVGSFITILVVVWFVKNLNRMFIPETIYRFYASHI
ncbi:hypothetical protein RF11_13493 [Thelohanellus kitauei]|uniref:Uncharacterized protein n=1 Tax=Thelohanellus kitauei TaxID=669202 RepID=A0A0C2NCF0_THEKT|nr:hypothetical protein RF11_13493 [Thelohanellus kitauei]